MNKKKYANGANFSLADDAAVGAPPTLAVFVEVERGGFEPAAPVALGPVLPAPPESVPVILALVSVRIMAPLPPRNASSDPVANGIVAVPSITTPPEPRLIVCPPTVIGAPEM